MFYVQQQCTLHHSQIKYTNQVQSNSQLLTCPRVYIQYINPKPTEEKTLQSEKLETKNSIHSFEKNMSRTKSTNIDPDELVKLIKDNWVLKGQINDVTEEVENLKENISQLKSLLEALQEQPKTKSARRRYQKLEKQ